MSKKVTDTETMILETKHLLIQLAEGNLSLPEPEECFKTRIEECEKGDLAKQKEATIYEMRVSQFKALGFHPLSYAEAVELLMGEPHTKTVDGPERKNYDYFFRHNEFTVTKGDKCTWGVSNPDSYVRMETKGSWFLPPFSKKVKWTVDSVFGLDDFKAPIPDQMLVALNHMRTKGFFNTYPGLQVENKGILLGGVRELLPEASSGGASTTFFIGLLGAQDG
jgi:hypothetical protein